MCIFTFLNLRCTELVDFPPAQYIAPERSRFPKISIVRDEDSVSPYFHSITGEYLSFLMHVSLRSSHTGTSDPEHRSSVQPALNAFLDIVIHLGERTQRNSDW